MIWNNRYLKQSFSAATASVQQHSIYISIRPKMEKSHSGCPRTSRFPIFFHFFLRPDLTFHIHVEIGPLFHLLLRSDIIFRLFLRSDIILFLRPDFSFQLHAVIFHHFSPFLRSDISSFWDRTLKSEAMSDLQKKWEMVEERGKGGWL